MSTIVFCCSTATVASYIHNGYSVMLHNTVFTFFTVDIQWIAKWITSHDPTLVC